MELDKQYRNGREEGMAEGREEGMDNISKLLKLLVSEKKYDEIEKIYYQVYGRIAQLLKKAQVTVFSCIIKIQQLNDLFFLDKGHNGIHLIDDKYNIALQKIIESYTHYLSANDGYGDVVYEARNSTGENSAKSPHPHIRHLPTNNGYGERSKKQHWRELGKVTGYKTDKCIS